MPVIQGVGDRRTRNSNSDLSFIASSRASGATQDPFSKTNMDWRDGSVVKSTDYSSRGPEFKSQQPHGGSQPSIMRSDTFFWCV